MAGKPSLQAWDRNGLVDRAAAAQAAGAFIHPGDAIDGAAAAHPEPRVLAASMLMRILADTLPDRRNCGGARRLKVGYARYCAYAYRVTPEVFDGLTGKEVAALVGVSERKWYDHLAIVDAVLANRRRDCAEL